MKIALTYAPSEQQFIPVPPLGIAVLCSYLKDQDIFVDMFDLELELWLSQDCSSSQLAHCNIDDVEISNTINLERIAELLLTYHVVCFSIMGKRQLPYVKSIIEKLKLNSNFTTSVIGGALLIEDNAYDILKKISADYAVVGEGWNPLHQVLRKITTGVYDKNTVKVQEKDGKFIFYNNEKKNSVIPIADYSNINLEGYITQQKSIYKLDYNEVTYQLLVGDRCCPYNCSFCRISKNTETIKNAKDISKEMIALNDLFECNNFSLICNEMNPTKDFVLDLVNTLIASKKKLKWFCYLRPNNLSINDFQKIKEAGCVLARFGVESGSQKILNHMNKKLYVDEMEQILIDSHHVGIWNHINVMTGYLYENNNDIENTLSFLRRNKDYIDSVRINPFFVPIGSPIHKDPSRFDIEIIQDTGSHIIFNQTDLNWDEKKKQINYSTSLILNECKNLGIGFAGILPNLVSTALCYFNDKVQAKSWLFENHSYLWQPVSPDTAKWKLAHPESNNIEINPWSKIAGERGENYQTRINNE
ncbi:MAG TPA: radical SAM protein [Candidatus Paceibacterota bacterium]